MTGASDSPRAVRLAALSLLPVMAVAAVAAGVTPQNVAVFGACLALLAVDTAAEPTADRQAQGATDGTGNR